MQSYFAGSLAVLTSIALALSCGDSAGAGGAGSTAGAGGAATTSGSTGGAQCDPLPTSGSSAGTGSTHSTTGGVTVGGLGVGGGTGLPDGRLKCFDAADGSGFDCTQLGKQCCAKKDVCWDPAAEPTFCDHPYCAH